MAILNTDGRHPSIVAVSRRFDIDHVTDPDARQVGMSVARLAAEMLARIRSDDVELTKSLDKLADARDGFMRAVIYTR